MTKAEELQRARDLVAQLEVEVDSGADYYGDRDEDDDEIDEVVDEPTSPRVQSFRLLTRRR